MRVEYQVADELFWGSVRVTVRDVMAYRKHEPRYLVESPNGNRGWAYQDELSRESGWYNAKASGVERGDPAYIAIQSAVSPATGREDER